MSKAKVALPIVLTILFFSLTLGSASAASQTTTIKGPVILKVNQYYVLYTTPDVPYIDKQNRFMLPLRAISELLGAHVSYDKISKKATVAWDGKTVEVMIGSRNVSYDGEITQLDTVPVIKQGQVFIPARVLLDGLKIGGSYKDSLLTITDEKFKQSKIISDIEISGIDFYNSSKGIAIETNDIRPLSYELTLPTANSDSKIATLKVKAKNISGKDMAKGTEDLRPTFISTVGYQFDPPNKESSPVKDGAMFERTWNRIDLTSGPLEYILAVGKTAD